MPQPIRIRTGLLEHADVVLERPRLAALIGLIASRWTRIENRMAMAFAGMLATEEEAALSIYLALIDRSTREAAFNAVAQSKLPRDMQDEARLLFQKMRQRSSERNTVVHGSWAVSPKWPQSLILMDPVDTTRWLFKLGHDATIDEVLPKRGIQTVIRLIEYNERDFLDIITRLTALEGEIFGFYFKVKRACRPAHGVSGAP